MTKEVIAKALLRARKRCWTGGAACRLIHLVCADGCHKLCCRRAAAASVCRSSRYSSIRPIPSLDARQRSRHDHFTMDLHHGTESHKELLPAHAARRTQRAALRRPSGCQ